MVERLKSFGVPFLPTLPKPYTPLTVGKKWREPSPPSTLHKADMLLRLRQRVVSTTTCTFDAGLPRGWGLLLDPEGEGALRVTRVVLSHVELEQLDDELG